MSISYATEVFEPKHKSESNTESTVEKKVEGEMREDESEDESEESEEESEDELDKEMESKDKSAALEPKVVDGVSMLNVNVEDIEIDPKEEAKFNEELVEFEKQEEEKEEEPVKISEEVNKYMNDFFADMEKYSKTDDVLISKVNI